MSARAKRLYVLRGSIDTHAPATRENVFAAIKTARGKNIALKSLGEFDDWRVAKHFARDWLMKRELTLAGITRKR